jgi:hypothetical protein
MDRRLYLPESWCKDAFIYDEGGISDQEKGNKAKQSFVVNILKYHVSLGISFKFYYQLWADSAEL